ncbi:MAG TPA: dihydrofolate reductase, partial [Planctomycetaceae bacterium]|nr:dihydrofolate reductase [Planctomycetaceae bacterium]
MLALIVAASENRVIGRQGDLPWRLPADLRRFRKLTMGHAVIMGRRTYGSLPGPLPGRRLIVLTSHPETLAAEVETATSLEEAL